MLNELRSGAVLLILVIAAPLGLDLCLPGLPLMSRELESSAGMTQWVINGFVLSWSFSQLFFGPVVDRLGAQTTLLCGGTIYIVSAVTVCFADSVHAVIAFRLLQGSGAGGMAVTVSASVPLRFKGASIGKVYSVLNGIISLIPVLAPVMGGVLIAIWGWRSAFCLLSIFITICMVLVLIRPLPPAEGGSQEKGHLEDTVVSILQDYRSVFREPMFRLGCFEGSCGFATQLVFFQVCHMF